MKHISNPTTIALKRAVRNNSGFTVFGKLDRDPDGSIPSWSSFATFEFQVRPRMSQDDLREIIEVKGIIGSGHDDLTTGDVVRYTGVYRPVAGSWSLWDDVLVRSAILGVPDHANICFEVRLDIATNPLMVVAGLHGDRFMMVAEWATKGGGNQRREFILDAVTVRHNPVRFGFGYQAERAA